MMLRKARPEEAETLWHVRNEAIRHGCKIEWVLPCWVKIRITRVWPTRIYAVLKWQLICKVRTDDANRTSFMHR